MWDDTEMAFGAAKAWNQSQSLCSHEGMSLQLQYEEQRPFVWAAHLFWSVLSHGHTQLDEMLAIA